MNCTFERIHLNANRIMEVTFFRPGVDTALNCLALGVFLVGEQEQQMSCPPFPFLGFTLGAIITAADAAGHNACHYRNALHSRVRLQGYYGLGIGIATVLAQTQSIARGIHLCPKVNSKANVCGIKGNVELPPTHTRPETERESLGR